MVDSPMDPHEGQPDPLRCKWFGVAVHRPCLRQFHSNFLLQFNITAHAGIIVLLQNAFILSFEATLFSKHGEHEGFPQIAFPAQMAQPLLFESDTSCSNWWLHELQWKVAFLLLEA